VLDGGPGDDLIIDDQGGATVRTGPGSDKVIAPGRGDLVVCAAGSHDDLIYADRSDTIAPSCRPAPLPRALPARPHPRAASGPHRPANRQRRRQQRKPLHGAVRQPLRRRLHGELVCRTHPQGLAGERVRARLAVPLRSPLPLQRQLSAVRHHAPKRSRGPGAGADWRLHHGDQHRRRCPKGDRDLHRLWQLERHQLEGRRPVLHGGPPLHLRHRPRLHPLSRLTAPGTCSRRWPRSRRWATRCVRPSSTCSPRSPRRSPRPSAARTPTGTRSARAPTRSAPSPYGPYRRLKTIGVNLCGRQL
jgi:hypothetical protein